MTISKSGTQLNLRAHSQTRSTTAPAYRCHLTEIQHRQVARRFPATNLQRSITVTTSSHIVLRSSPEPGEHVLDEDALTWIAEDPARVRASYILEGPTVSSNPSVPTQIASTAQRRALVALAETGRGLINPAFQPQGLGNWQWLEPGVDDVASDTLGFASPDVLALARQNGMLAVGRAPDAGPVAVWLPDLRYLNPEVQPDVPGIWRYFTTGPASSQDLAYTNFGGQDGFGFATNTTPSAEDIFRLRRSYADRGSEDYTADIDLVFVPDAASEQAGDSVAREFAETGVPGELPAPHTPDMPSDSPIHSASDTTTPSSDTHDPKNRGENDQTGDNKAEYCTLTIDSKQGTLDRSYLRLNCRQNHKLWVHTKDGSWKQWAHAGTMNWTDSSSNKRVNRWRDQMLRRNGWPAKRTEMRKEYTLAERQFVFDYAKQSKQGNLKDSIAAIASNFHKKFGETRDVLGIAALLERLKKEYDLYNGQMKPVASAPSSEKRAWTANGNPEPAKKRKVSKGSADEG